MFDISKGYVRDCCEEVRDGLLSSFSDEVRLPTREGATVSAVTFAHRFDIHGCIGAVDGTHIRFR
jgi:hypothetical protein